MKLIKQIAAKAANLPPLPGVLTRVLDITSVPDFPMKELVHTVSLDPSITASVLRRCNSSFFGLRYKAESIAQAVPLLGLEHLVEVVISSSMSSYYAGAPTRVQLWRHSMATALIARQLANTVAFKNLAPLFTSALLHDIGKLAMSEVADEEFDRINFYVAEEGYSYIQAEMAVLGITHAELGADLAKKWHLTESVREGIAFHHNPSHAKGTREIANLVSLASYLAIEAGEGSGMGGDNQMLPRTAMFEIRRLPHNLDELVVEMKTLMQRAAPLLELSQ